MHQRRIRLVNARLQLKICAVFLAASLTCLLVLFSLVQLALSDATLLIRSSTVEMVSHLQQSLWDYLFISLLLMVPLTLTMGVVVTFKVCGPIYRLERYMESLAHGEDPGPLSFRSTDDLQEIPPLVNAALRVVRQQAADEAIAHAEIAEFEDSDEFLAGELVEHGDRD